MYGWEANITTQTKIKNPLKTKKLMFFYYWKFGELQNYKNFLFWNKEKNESY